MKRGLKTIEKMIFHLEKLKTRMQVDHLGSYSSTPSTCGSVATKEEHREGEGEKK